MTIKQLLEKEAIENCFSCNVGDIVGSCNPAKTQSTEKKGGKMKYYQVEVGILIKEDEKEFLHYNNAYDQQYGYYDENLWFTNTLDEAIKGAFNYVKAGVERTYAIISELEAKCDEDIFINDFGNIVDNEGCDYCCEFINFDKEYVIKSYRKENKEIIEDFIKR